MTELDTGAETGAFLVGAEVGGLPPCDVEPREEPDFISRAGIQFRSIELGRQVIDSEARTVRLAVSS